MILHPLQIIHQKDNALLCTRIELETPRQHFPEYLWYRVPYDYAKYLSTQSDAFLLPALLIGMHFGEAIEVRGSTSPHLAYNLPEYQHLLAMRFPQYLRKVAVRYEHLEMQGVEPFAVGTTFSGGVDSFFTLWKHIPQNQALIDFRVTHAIFLKGFDLIHAESQYYWMLFQRYHEGLAQLGVELIPLETNIASLRHLRLPGHYLFGPTLLGAAHSLAGMFRLFYIPSSWDYHALKAHSYSSDPWLDRLASSDTLRMSHHGAQYRRVEKVAQIADWDLPQRLLWVCLEYKFEEQGWNCGRCEKCARTMIPLYALGKLDRFKTFARPLQSNREGLWWARKFSRRHDFASEMFPFVKMHKPDFLPWLRVAVILGTARDWFVSHIPRFIQNWLRKYGYFVTHNEAPDAYEIPAVTKVIHNHYDHPPA